VLQHALVLTDDLDATRDFYCDVLGFEVGETPPLPFAGVWLASDGVVCLHLADRAEYETWIATLAMAATVGGVDHLAFRRADYDALATRIARAGVDAVANEPPGTGLRQLFVMDPNGVRVELNVPL
jgi:catechol 2,3-dioxygenase-like lactoylglutathione lyase family enzyme